MVRFDPLRELEEMSTGLNSLFGRPADRADVESLAVWTPSVDVEENDREYVVKADLPDVNRSDVKVSIEDGVLSVEGERTHEKEEATKKYHRVERAYGKFVRRLMLPSDVDATNVGADFKNGVLTIRLPKSRAAEPRAVEVAVK
jgi:HSP20 family protein